MCAHLSLYGTVHCVGNMYIHVCVHFLSLLKITCTCTCLRMCFRYSVPEATTVSRLPGLQGQSPAQLVSWPDSPLPPPSRSRAHTTQPTPLVSLTSGNRPRTHTTGHSSMLQTRGRSPLQNNRMFICHYFITFFFLVVSPTCM